MFMENQIEKEFGTIICKFPVLHKNWEMDGEGFVVEKDNKRNVVLTNHNKPYLSSVQELQDKLAEYTKATFDTKKAITLVTKNGKLD